MDRIVILGRGGAGKTTLANQIGGITRGSVICLDAIWQPDWTEKDVPHFRSILQDAHNGDRWVSDGNFAAATFDIRLPRATVVIWLERSKMSCSMRAVKRIFKPGEPHRLKGIIKVLRFIWQFDRINRPRIEALRTNHGPDVPVRALSSDQDIADFLSEIRSHQKASS